MGFLLSAIGVLAGVGVIAAVILVIVGNLMPVAMPVVTTTQQLLLQAKPPTNAYPADRLLLTL